MVNLICSERILRYVKNSLIFSIPFLNELLTQLNSLFENTKFTIKVEKNNQFPFLDVLLTKKVDGGLNYQVFRKNIHTDIYIHIDFHHHPTQQIGFIKTLATKDTRISDSEHLTQEFRHLRTVFMMNIYHEKLINK